MRLEVGPTPIRANEVDQPALDKIEAESAQVGVSISLRGCS